MTDFYTNMRFTHDAHTYTEWRQRPLGRLGEFMKPVIYRRLGSGRYWVIEVLTTDDCRADLVAAEVQITPAGP